MTNKTFGRGSITQLSTDPVSKKVDAGRKMLAELEAKAYARGYAQAIEDAAKVADAEQSNWLEAVAVGACENIVIDIRALLAEKAKP